MSAPKLLVMHCTEPGTGQWMGKAIARIVESCEGDPNAETDGRELTDHLLEAYQLPAERSRYLFLLAVNDVDVLGHCIARIDQGYEGRKTCLVGFLSLDKGIDWGDIVKDGGGKVERWAKHHGCEKISLHAHTKAHARLYRMARYGPFDESQLVMSRRI